MVFVPCLTLTPFGTLSFLWICEMKLYHQSSFFCESTEHFINLSHMNYILWLEFQKEKVDRS
jgi:hypothetical protein